MYRPLVKDRSVIFGIFICITIPVATPGICSLLCYMAIIVKERAPITIDQRQNLQNWASSDDTYKKKTLRIAPLIKNKFHHTNSSEKHFELLNPSRPNLLIGEGPSNHALLTCLNLLHSFLHRVLITLSNGNNISIAPKNMENIYIDILKKKKIIK